MDFYAVIRSTNWPIQLGDLAPDEISILASNGLREKSRDAFQRYERQMREVASTRATAEAEDKRFIEGKLHHDKPKIQEETRDIIRTLYARVYP